jgi:hypothetical protein
MVAEIDSLAVWLIASGNPIFWFSYALDYAGSGSDHAKIGIVRYLDPRCTLYF